MYNYIVRAFMLWDFNELRTKLFRCTTRKGKYIMTATEHQHSFSVTVNSFFGLGKKNLQKALPLACSTNPSPVQIPHVVVKGAKALH